MKRLLIVLVSSVALSAAGQTGSDGPRPASESGSNPSLTITIQPGDRARQMVFPSGDELRTLVDATDDISSRAQAGCPVQIVDASFERRGQVMLTADNNRRIGPTLNLNYRNASGKDIESVRLTGWIKVKDNPYQLDYVTHPFTLELSGRALLGKDIETTQVLKLASNAFGFDRIELSQVVYVDGTSWKQTRKNCAFQHDGGSLRAKAW
jgi:hypothetical protein